MVKIKQKEKQKQPIAHFLCWMVEGIRSLDLMVNLGDE